MRVAIYSRFSSHLQREASIEDQVRLCRERAVKAGWTVCETFADRGISGASLLRPGLQGLIEGAMAGRFEVVLAEALDRLSRDQADVAALYKRLMFAGVQSVLHLIRFTGSNAKRNIPNAGLVLVCSQSDSD